MTPPSGGSEVAAQPAIVISRPPPSRLAARICDRLLNGREWRRVRVFADAVVLCLAATLALFADPTVSAVASNLWLSAFFVIAVLGMMNARRAPEDRFNASLLETSSNVVGVVSLAAMLTISVDAIEGSADPLALAPRLWLFSVVYLGTARLMLVLVRRQAMRTDAGATPTLVVGAGMVGAHLVRRLVAEPRYGLRPVGFLDSDPLPTLSPAPGTAVPVLGGPDQLGSAIAATGARHVILAFSQERDEVLVAKIRECQALSVEVSLVPRLYESINDRTTLDHVGGLPLLTLHSIDPHGWQFDLKHAFDRGVALVLLCLLSPLLLALAVGVRLSSPGTCLFRQRRVGRDEREFTMLKFRTMRGNPANVGEADAGWAAAAILDAAAGASLDPASIPLAVDRTTAIGRVLRDYSLDELPQLVNVLRGEMSLVGPRPERVAYVRDFGRHVDRYGDRHRVRSGMTGWAQVNGLRGETSIADRVEWDNYYIQNWSLRLDLRIIALTVTAIFRSSARA